MESDALNRINGALGRMKTFHAPQALRRLTLLGAVSEGEVAAWNALRNTSAHGDAPESVSTEDMQRLLDNSFCLNSLLYRLVFTAIEYEGIYSDYATRGWPPAVHTAISPAAIEELLRGLDTVPSSD